MTNQTFRMPVYVCQWIPPASDWPECSTLEEFAAYKSHDEYLAAMNAQATELRKQSNAQDEWLIARCYWSVAKMREHVAMEISDWTKSGRYAAYGIGTAGNVYGPPDGTYPVDSFCDVVIYGKSLGDPR